VSCPINNLLDPPADFRVGQGAPTSHSGYYGEEAQRRPARKDAAQRASYLWDRTLERMPPAAERLEHGDLILNQRGVGGRNGRVRGDQRLLRGEQLEIGQ
jgi:hypothetical protein